MVTRSHPLSRLRSLSFPHHGLAMDYSHTCLFLWDFVEGSTGRTTENVHVSRSLSKYHQGLSKLMTTPVKSRGNKVRRHQDRLGNPGRDDLKRQEELLQEYGYRCGSRGRGGQGKAEGASQ